MKKNIKIKENTIMANGHDGRVDLMVNDAYAVSMSLFVVNEAIRTFYGKSGVTEATYLLDGVYDASKTFVTVRVSSGSVELSHETEPGGECLFELTMANPEAGQFIDMLWDAISFGCI